jgi:transposase
VIEPLLPNKPRGVPRVDDRRVLNGIFWVLRSGAPWRDLPERYAPHTTYPEFTVSFVMRRDLIADDGNLLGSLANASPRLPFKPC